MEKQHASNTSIYVNLTAMTCGGCGIAFAMPDKYYRELVSENGSFYCPRGCSRKFIGKTKEEELKEQLEVERQQKIHWQREAKTARGSAAAFKGQITKTKKRVAKGVCPCCNRYFVNLHRHMDSQHKDYNK